MRLKIKLFTISLFCMFIICAQLFFGKIHYQAKVLISNFNRYNRHFHSNKSSIQNEQFNIDQKKPTYRNENFKKSAYDLAASMGNLFPRFNESKYRINEQLEFVSTHADFLNTLPPKILLRVGDFNFEDLHWNETAEHCPINNCKFISDLTKSNQVDALVFSELDENLLKNLLPKPKNQIWIAQHLESPKHNRIETGLLKNLINWTASYRPDSTIPIPYGYPVPIQNDYYTDPIPFNRTKKVAWIVSNCHATNYRREYADELSKHIQVDIYGKCGEFECDKKHGCLQQIRNDYKFYLAFENSNCANYISEKFYYSSLNHDMIPIVMGASRKEYETLMPDPMSFIHVDDFRCPAHLASYLHKLDSNATLYNKYFEWKTKFRFDELAKSKYYCRMCAALHLRDLVSYVHWYEDYSRWWDVCS